MIGIQEKTYRCCSCTRKMVRSMFHKDSSRKTGITSRCKDCDNRRWQLRTSLKDRTEYARRMSKIHRENNPEKHRARVLVREALKAGILKKQPCRVCGKEKVEGHHADYEKPLEVLWLCHKHHMQIHHSH